MSEPEKNLDKSSVPDLPEHPLQTTRRGFIQTLGASVGTAMVAPALPGAVTDSDYPHLAALRKKHAEKGVILPDKTYRTMELSLHLPPEGLFNIDVPGSMARTRDAGTECVLLYAQDHWGYAHYPSDVGVRHPNLKGDFFGSQVEAARKLGMSVICYYSLQFNTQIVLKHPDWGWTDEKGELERWRWLVTCLDTPYRQYVLGMIDELFSRYQMDELFLDIFGIQFVGYNGSGRNPFCFCKYTEEAWNTEHPGDPYRAGFATREGWEARYRWHQKRSMTDMLDEIIAAMRKHQPKSLIGLNGGPESFPDDIQQRVSFLYAEPIPSTTGIALGTILLRGWGRPDFQAGVWNAYDYVDMNRSAVTRVQANALIVQNARTFFIGEAPLVSGINGGKGYSDRWFNIARDAWQDVRNVDCLLEGVEPVLSSAVLYSQATQNEMAAEKRPTDFRSSMLGALELLTFTGRPVESIPDFRLSPDLLKQLDTLVLPETEALSDVHAELIRRWVSDGGTLIASGKSGLRDEKLKVRSNFALADVFGVDYTGEERKYAYFPDGKPRTTISTYIESSGHPLAEIFGQETVGLPESFVTINRRGAEEVMRYLLPFMVEDTAHYHWYNWFSSPPGTESGGSAVTLNRFGKGRALYLGVPIFSSEASKHAYEMPMTKKQRPCWVRDWVPPLIRKLVPHPIAEVRSEPFSECVYGTCFWDKSKRYILVQVLNTNQLITEGEPRKAPPVHISVDSQRLPLAGARAVWPKEQALTVERRQARDVVVLPEVDVYTALYLKLA